MEIATTSGKTLNTNTQVKNNHTTETDNDLSSEHLASKRFNQVGNVPHKLIINGNKDYHKNWPQRNIGEFLIKDCDFSTSANQASVHIQQLAKINKSSLKKITIHNSRSVNKLLEDICDSITNVEYLDLDDFQPISVSFISTMPNFIPNLTILKTGLYPCY